MSALHHACKAGYLPIVKLILSFDAGKDTINFQSITNGYTPLMETVFSQDDGGPEIAGPLILLLYTDIL